MPRLVFPPAVYAIALLLLVIVMGGAGWALAGRAQNEGTAGPRRIVSLNLCTDQLVLALADRDRIAGLSRNARDPNMSAAAAQAHGLPILTGSAEEILAIDPDLILGASTATSAMLGALRGRDYRTLDLAFAQDYADIIDQIRAVAFAVGRPARGERLIARMDTALAAIPAAGDAGVAAYYQRRGYMTGTDTLVDDMMARVGLQNLAGTLGKPPLSRISLEEMVAARPDFLIVESATDRVTDQGTEMLHHPVLADFARLRIPEAWTVCGGPAYVLAAQSLSRQIAAHAHQKPARMPT